MRTIRALGVVATMALVADAHAGTIRGSLRLVSPPTEVRVGGTVAEEPGVAQAVVWVDSLPPQVLNFYRGRPRNVRIVQSGRQFHPRVTVVVKGSSISFANRDKVYHNVFSVSSAKRFDLGKYAPRASHSVTFDQLGIVNLFCDIHPWMAAYVVVLPHRAFARPSRAGRFLLPMLPPGRYLLRVWHPTHGELSREVEVPLHGDLVVALSL